MACVFPAACAEMQSALRPILNDDVVINLNRDLETVKRMSPRPRKASDEEVFAAAHRVMSRLGPAQWTLADIAAEAGLTAGAWCSASGSKRGLLARPDGARSPRRSREIFAGLPSYQRSPLAALRALCRLLRPDG